MHFLKHKYNPDGYIAPRTSRISKQPRKWAAKLTERRVYHEMTEEKMTPKLAMMAMEAIMAQIGCVIELVNDYDPRRDEFHITAHEARDGEFRNYIVPGETVAAVVKDVRDRFERVLGARPSFELPSDKQWLKIQSS